MIGTVVIISSVLLQKMYEESLDSSATNANNAMISELVNPLDLIPEYKDNPLPGFLKGIRHISVKYKSMRKVRGDGNCFYRAFLFSYLENLHNLKDSSELLRFTNLIKSSKEQLVAIGYDEFTFEYFYDTLMALLEELFDLSIAELLEKFQEQGESDYYTWYMRLLTALNLRKEPERYLPFILDTPANGDINVYCRQEVEPMGRECEEMQIIALSEYLGLYINIEYLDGRDFDDSNGLNVVLCNGNNLKGIDESLRNVRTVYLLYRPGHYDILYK